MANTHITLTSLFTDIANAIRTKTDSSSTLIADNFPTAILGIETFDSTAKVYAGTSTPSNSIGNNGDIYFVKEDLTIGKSIKLTPSALDTINSSYDSIDSAYPASNVIGKDENSSTFTRFYMATGVSAITRLFYKFDVSSIPSNATITGVTCKVKAKVENTNMSQAGNNFCYIGYGSYLMACNQGVANGEISSATKTYSDTESTVTVSSVEFTRSQVDSLVAGLIAARGLVSSNDQFYIDYYGASATINYTIPDPNGSYRYLMYKKVNGSWVLQSNATTVIDSKTKYTS